MSVLEVIEEIPKYSKSDLQLLHASIEDFLEEAQDYIEVKEALAEDRSKWKTLEEWMKERNL
ncbi:MAG: hypothetical protein K2W99_01745 [Chthoniobacterales bacterium]|nr:hypothetical protein [Chthoniobacterales bacterium]